MKVSFIIPLFNCLPLTQAMLASLRQTLPPGLDHEIIFVDDGSTDGTGAWLHALPPHCRALRNERNLGFAKSCNRGAASAAGEFLVFLNNDLEFHPRWLEPMLAAFDRVPRAGLVGNVQLVFSTGAVDHTGIYFTHQGKPAHCTVRPWFSPTGLRRTAALTGACFAIRAATWRQLGGFDEGYVNGCEDVDLCLRSRAAGFSCHVALHSVVKHHISQSAGRKLRDEQNTARLVERWADTIAALAAPAWSRWQISTHAQHSHRFDYPLVCAALAHVLLRGRPPRLVRTGVAAAMQQERQRWHALLNGIPAPSEPSPAAPI